MCGIFAAFNVARDSSNERCFKNAVSTATHRGPDNAGFWQDEDCFLGHNRLSIIGIEPNGNQPFHLNDLVMVFNGEIFNYVELREELVQLGYSFQTRSDTEVVLRAFDHWGTACFARFNGMWAMVIYDKRKKTLTVSRDRFGQKPLFVLRQGPATYFASEVQQLTSFCDKAINFELIQVFLKEGTYEAEGRTFFKAVEEFPKAHYAELSGGHRSDAVRYWDYWSGAVEEVTDSCFQKFSELLRDAVRIRLRADVPFGSLLSGGVDSTIVSAMARGIAGPEPDIRAFTYASEDSDDEFRFAKKVADKLNLSLSVRFQDRAPEDYRERLSGLVRHMGRGHSSPAIVSVDYLYQAVSEGGIKVVLDGQGADELLAGYKQYFFVIIPLYLLTGNFKQAAYFLRDQIEWGFLTTVILHLRLVLPERAKRMGRWLYGYERFFKTYIGDGSRPTFKKRDSVGRNSNALNRHLIYLHDIGLENLLFYGDIVAMKNSVENRSPFMDHRLVDFVLSRSEKLKLWNGRSKYALRLLPEYKTFEDVLERKKIGFSSDIRPATKSMMMKELKDSPILAWPIFSGKLSTFISEGGFEAPKYERLLFRFYQVHLWNEIFQ